MKKGRIYAFLVAVVAAVVFFASTAAYFYPGESASLVAAWKGLTVDSAVRYPLMALIAKAFGGGNLIAPLAGAIAVFFFFRLISVFIFNALKPDNDLRRHGSRHLAFFGALAAVAVFAMTPAVRSAATHLEPRMFHFAWALGAFALVLPFAHATRKSAWLYPLLLGVVIALGMVDSALLVALLPLYLLLLWRFSRNDKIGKFASLVIFFFSLVVTYVVALTAFDLSLGTSLRTLNRELRLYVLPAGWLYVLLFSTLPFLIGLFAAHRSLSNRPGPVTWISHLGLTFASVLALATPLAAGTVLEKYGILPVATSAFASALVGYLVVFWWQHRRNRVSIIAGSVYAFVLLITVICNLFMFDSSKSEFADKVARAIIDDLGEREYIVTDGTIDNHLLLVAEQCGKKLMVISLAHDSDDRYLKLLAQRVREEKMGGEKAKELSLTLTLGVLPFVKEYLKADPDAAKKMVIFGAPDLWLSAGIDPVPEFFFFGGDRSVKPDWTRWKEFDRILEAPRGWGSYHGRDVQDPVERLKLSLRRHLGLVANNRGVYLQDQRQNDEAWKMYELVLKEIDRDNISAIFNEVAMLSAKHEAAVAKKRELDRMVKAAVDDKKRRYMLWQLGSYYGYVRNPDVFVRLGHTWAKSGRPGEALSQLSRAMEFVPDDKRNSLLNIMAALYADERNVAKSRQIYESVIAKKSDDHDALIGLMRLELAAGNDKKALEYLERASKSASVSGKRLEAELAMAALMRNDLAGAKARFEKLTKSDCKDMQSWSLLSATVIQMIDAEKDDKKCAALEKELESIVSEMGRQSRDQSDYYLLSARGFLLLRKGAAQRKAAREAFAAAAAARPSAQPAQDMVLNLDISLSDKQAAENHARGILKRNRNAPLANYVMGSLSLERGALEEAEMFLRRAVDTEKPTPLALNDLAETLRRRGQFAEAEKFARRCVKSAPKFYIAWETLGSIIAEAKGDLVEAVTVIEKACKLVSDENGRVRDSRMLVSLAKVQLKSGDKAAAKKTVGKLSSYLSKLDPDTRKQYQELKNLVK